MAFRLYYYEINIGNNNSHRFQGNPLEFSLAWFFQGFHSYFKGLD